MNIGGLLLSRGLYIEGIIDEISQPSPTDTAYLAHAPWSKNVVPKCAHGVILYNFVVQKNTEMANCWIYTIYYLYSENKTVSIFLKWGIAMLNSLWIPYVSNPSNHMKQKQKAGIQFVSITYNLNEYIHYWLTCDR